MEEVVVGIDLGTSNSCVAVVQDGRPKIIEDERGYNILPSCVAYKSEGKFVVGHGAKAMVLTSPAQTAYAVKRVIGRKFSSREVQEAQKRLTYDFLEGEKDSVLARLGEIELTPEEISSIVLKCIKEVAERHVGAKVTQAVVSVPAYFNHAQRTATIEAARLADLEVLRLVNEPTAAALAYGFGAGINRTIGVYDLGGGTFDISLLRIMGDVFEVVSTAGDTYLGGDDFDLNVIEHLLSMFNEDERRAIVTNLPVMQRLKKAAEDAKIALSGTQETEIHVQGILKDNRGFDRDLTAPLGRNQFNELVFPLVSRTFGVCDDALREAKLNPHELEAVIMVGGMTRCPLIIEAVATYFGRTPEAGVNPDEVVAVGAAIQAHNLTHSAAVRSGSGRSGSAPESSALLIDVTPQSLGVGTVGGYVERLIERNTPIPTGISKLFTTSVDDQMEVRISVYQGESRMSDDNELLGEFVLGG
ncbi:MAG: Hsp70 family protein, partial [Myxococcota bacterium]|nr:Hsp70 family protein [Myxococcota bacterium]